MPLEKAAIDVLAGSRSGKRIKVLFNPAEYTIDRSNAFKATAVPGLSGPLLHFINGDADMLSMELFLDDYTDTPPKGLSVQQRLDDLTSLLEIDPELHAPPPVRFIWGKLAFKAVLEKMSRKITLFRPEGTPARATLTVSFKELKTLGELIREPKLQSADRSKRRLIVGSDTLWLLAAREYNDAARWRVIAESNDLDDPRDIAPGDWVTVPRLEPNDGTGDAR
jgi:nucleoid-associated protein YgaU